MSLCMCVMCVQVGVHVCVCTHISMCDKGTCVHTVVYVNIHVVCVVCVRVPAGICACV